MRIKVISCDVLYRELCYAAARSEHQVDVQFLTKGLHDEGCRPMRLRLQAEIDKTDGPKYDAIVLGYALCGNGTVGLTARHLPVVIPRAHDCITLLMGSKKAYEDYFDSHSGVYFRSTGWLERDFDAAAGAVRAGPAEDGRGLRSRGPGLAVRRRQRPVSVRAVHRVSEFVQAAHLHQDGHRAQ